MQIKDISVASPGIPIAFHAPADKPEPRRLNSNLFYLVTFLSLQDRHPPSQ